jgi:lipid-A-disaccharide synthase
MPPTPLLLSAGEASGDMYAAKLATALKQRMDVSIFGMGGPLMRAAGVEIITDYSEISVVGITEVLKRLPSLVRAMGRLVKEAENRKPPIAILTDFPGFHLRLARKLKLRGVRNVYYICPQFWAWRPWRVNLVRRRFAKALCIFPFEEKFYRDAGVPVKFIGHPLVGNVSATLTREEFSANYGLATPRKIITILPGSRRGEIEHHLPILVEAVSEIARRFPDAVEFVVAVAPGLDMGRLRKKFRPEWPVHWVQGDTYNAVAAADLAIVSSGTATVETALLGKPMIVIYRLSNLTATLAKPFVRTRLFGMVNLIAGRALVPELIQQDFTAEKIASEAAKLLTATTEGRTAVADTIAGLEEVRSLLGPPGAVERAADEIIHLLEPTRSNAK